MSNNYERTSESLALNSSSVNSSANGSYRCRPRLRLKLFKRKEILLVLMYNFLMVIMFFGLSLSNVLIEEQYIFRIVFAICACTSPLAGLLADTYFSRYTVIKYSMRFIWISVVVYFAVFLVFYVQGMCTTDFHYCMAIKIILSLCLTFGLGACLPNIIQFGMDQLHDSSSSEITAFIMWYIWTWAFAALVVIFSQNCFCDKFKLVNMLLFPASTGFALCLDFLFSSWLVKEPVSRSPFSLLIGVLRYAIKNKYPQQRSAFTYWDNARYSRMDLAKKKFGGPFTTEQVEDVKMFLRMLALLFLGCVLAGFWLSTDIFDRSVLYHLRGAEISYFVRRICEDSTVADCFELLLVHYFGYLVMFMYVLVHEFIIYPLFWKHILESYSVLKLKIAFFFLVLYYVAITILEAVGYQYLSMEEKANSTCSLGDVKHRSFYLPLNYKWFFIPHTLDGFFYFFIGCGAVEFICAQAPYSMKGLMFGILFLFVGWGTLFVSLLLLPVLLTVQNWHPVPFGCGFWFYLSVVLLLLVCILPCTCLLKRLYKTRRRDEEIHNRHIFAIDYYTRYLQRNRELSGDY